jgi:ketosteroid isomerase-like protein
MSIKSTKAMEILNKMFAAKMQFFHSDSKDHSSIGSAFHPDIVVHESKSVPYAGDWSGYEELIKLWGKMNECWESMKVEDMQAAINEDTTFLTCTLIAKTRSSGIVTRQPFSEYLKLKDDLVVKAIPFYYDTVAINQALEFNPDMDFNDLY